MDYCALLGNIHVYHHRHGALRVEPIVIIRAASVVCGTRPDYGQPYWDWLNEICPCCQGSGKRSIGGSARGK